MHKSDAETADSGDESGTQHNSGSHSASDADAADKSTKGGSRSTRTARASSKKAAKAITAACIDLEDEGSDKDAPGHGADSDADTEPNESPSAAGRAAGRAAALEQIRAGRQQQKKKIVSRQASPAKPDSGSEAEADSQQMLQDPGSGSKGSPQQQPLPSCHEDKSEHQALQSLGLSSDDESEVEPECPQQPESGADAVVMAESDAEAESPVAVMLKSNKLRRIDGSAVDCNADEGKA